MSDIRWEGLAHEEIYAAVHRGPGAAVSKPAEDAWAETEALILRIDERIASAMAGSQAGWEGSAADATRSAMTPLGHWALDAARQAKLTAAGVTGQSLQASYVRKNMPEPNTAAWNAEVGKASTDPTYIFHGLDDMHAVEQDAANRAARAVDLMNNYTADSDSNRRYMVSWDFPPQVTVVTDVAASGPGDPGVPAPPAAAQPPAPGGTPPVPGAAAPPAAAPPVGAPPASSPGAPGLAPVPPAVPPSGPGSAPAGPATVLPALVPPVPGQPPGGNAPAPAAMSSAPTRRGPTPIPGIPPPGTSTVPPVAVPPVAPGTGRPWLPGATPPGSPHPVVPGPPRDAPPPNWRDVIPGSPTAREPGDRFPAPGAVEPDRGQLPGARPTPEPGARAAAEPAARPVATGAPPGPRPAGALPPGLLYPPLAAGYGAGAGRERRRPDYLLDDSGAFEDDRWFPPPVITPDDCPQPWS